MVAFADPSRIPTHGSPFARRRDRGGSFYLHPVLAISEFFEQIVEAVPPLIQNSGCSIGHPSGPNFGFRPTASISQIHKAQIQARVTSHQGGR